MTAEAPVLVRCGGCGARFELSARRARDHRGSGASPRCRTCRRKPREVDEAQRARFVQWWLDELGAEAARELARAIYG